MLKSSTFITSIFLVLATLFFSCKSEQEKNDSSLYSTNQSDIVIGTIDSLESEILGETRQFWVHVPESYQNKEFGELRYPVVYTTDGNVQFHPVSGMVRYMSSNMNTEFPEMIVVGIIHSDRNSELTPTEGMGILPDGGKIPMPSGGGVAFQDFIEKELIPHIEEHYPATTYRTFMGHSLGGLSAVQALYSRPHLFNNYIAVDASLWWNDGNYLEEAKEVISKGKFENKSLFVAIANTLNPNQTLEEVLADTSQISLHIRANFDFAKSAKKWNNGIRSSWKYYENENHGTVPFNAHYDAFKFIFDWHEFDFSILMDPNFKPTPEGFVQDIKNHYNMISNKLGHKVIPPGGDMITLAQAVYGYLGNFDVAHAILDMNIAHFPNSQKVYEAKADAYAAMLKNEEAISYYQRALNITQSEAINAKIEAINNSEAASKEK